VLVPGIERLDFGPDATELRYFRVHEREEAERLAGLLRDLGLPARATYVRGHESSSRIRPRHFELWLASAAGAPE
jgi:hypothetical protein